MMVGHRDAVYEEESAEVEVLFNEAAKLAALQKKFQAVNNRLQDGGNVMKDALGSAYGSTQSLQVMNKSKPVCSCGLYGWLTVSRYRQFD